MQLEKMKRCPTHPGEFLKTEFLPWIDMTHDEIAEWLGWDISHFNEFINGNSLLSKSEIDNLTSLTGISYKFWLNLQENFQTWKQMQIQNYSPKTGGNPLNIRPIGMNVLVRMDRNEAKTEGGIHIPETTQEVSNKATLIEIGDECLYLNLEDINKRVVFNIYAGEEIPSGGEKYRLLSEEEILGVFSETDQSQPTKVRAVCSQTQ